MEFQQVNEWSVADDGGTLPDGWKIGQPIPPNHVIRIHRMPSDWNSADHLNSICLGWNGFRGRPGNIASRPRLPMSLSRVCWESFQDQLRRGTTPCTNQVRQLMRRRR